MTISITLAGVDHYADYHDLNANQIIKLKKEPSNKYDNEAIAVYTSDDKLIGYVANSVYTVAKGTYSAGRLYDKIGNEASATIFCVPRNGDAIAIVNINDEKNTREV